MAQDRLSYLCERLEEGVAIAAVLRAARALVNTPPALSLSPDIARFKELEDAMEQLHAAAYIELPDDAG